MLTQRALLEGFPLEACAALLKRAMTPAPAEAWDTLRYTKGDSRIVLEPKVARRPPVRRKGFSRRYTVVRDIHDARRGTWRAHMLDCILAHTDTASAENWHVTTGLHPDQRLDFNWAVKAGYIEF